MRFLIEPRRATARALAKNAAIHPTIFDQGAKLKWKVLAYVANFNFVAGPIET